MKESYFMGIDTGTNSSKGVLINSHGEIIAEHTTEHAMTNPAPGHYEHDADKDWWGDLCNLKFHHLTLKQSEQVHLVPTAYLSTISVDLYAKLSYMVLMHVQPMR